MSFHRCYFVFFALIFSSVVNGSYPAKSTCTPAQFDVIKTKIKTAARARNDKHRWPGRLLRAGFHDCLAKSCDGSVKLELDRNENRGIDVTLALLENQIDGSCCSLADAIKLGMVASMELSGGPSFSCPLKTTRTATSANPTGKIPSPLELRGGLMKKFKVHGFTDNEVLAGNFGGHSLGRFEINPARGITADLFRRIPPFGFRFTPKEDEFNNRFCRFMVDPFFRLFTAPLPTWNNLPSDRVLSLLSKDLRVVRSYRRDNGKLRRDFKSFMEKLCRL